MRKLWILWSCVVLIAVFGANGAVWSAADTEQSGKDAGFSYTEIADLVFALVSANRKAYSRVVVERLTLTDKVITASEHFVQDKALPLPAQIFRLGALLASDGYRTVTYTLESSWPINAGNKPVSEIENTGLSEIMGGKNFYGQETVDGVRYFIAVYPDKAINQSCVQCHNKHKDSPRRDFALGDIMGGIVIRIRMNR